MSVSFARAVAEGLKAYGVTVRYWEGWETRGNGQVSAYQGLVWHHTASNYGKAYGTLVTGRAGLSGPLCNSSGDDDGGITIIAAHPANHAGASGGRNMGPLPTTRSFNKVVWGHEIVYPGTKPMTDAQKRSAIILGVVVSKILRRPNGEWCRGHFDTSITGKFDPGYAPGKTVDLNAWRREVTGLMGGALVPKPPAPKTLKKGDKGPEVKRLQEALNATGLFRLVADENFGPATDTAVRVFQNMHGLVSDGIAGPATLAKLGLTPRATNDEEDDMFTDEDRRWIREELARRDDVGHLRGQVLTALGIDDPEAFPTQRTPEENDAVEPARRVDVGHARDQTLEAIATLKSLLRELEEKLDRLSDDK
jgi:hypothetical protein